MKTIGTTVAIIFLFTGMAGAEPGSTVKYLMNEPVSLLDMGLYKMEQRLIAMLRETGGEKTYISVEYEFNTNKIEVLHSTHQKVKDRDMAKNECRMAIAAIRIYLGFGLREFFEHEGYQRGKVPKDLDKKLRAITEISATAYYSGKKKELILVSCKSLLNSDEVYCRDSGPQ